VMLGLGVTMMVFVRVPVVGEVTVDDSVDVLCAADSDSVGLKTSDLESEKSLVHERDLVMGATKVWDGVVGSVGDVVASSDEDLPEMLPVRVSEALRDSGDEKVSDAVREAAFETVLRVLEREPESDGDRLRVKLGTNDPDMLKSSVVVSDFVFGGFESDNV
jgi:hypothetical protein